MLRLHNSLTRRKELFRPLVEGQVGVYTCGPTLHADAHVGLMRRLLAVDVLKRALKSEGYQVRHIVNLTDVDDKTIAESGRRGARLAEVTGPQADAFFEDGHARLRLTAPHAPALRERAGQDVILGVRPEAIALAGEGRFAGQDNTLDALVSVIEPLGEKMDVLVSAGPHPALTARVDAQASLAAGQPLRLHLDMRKVHIFEPGEPGLNLGRPTKARRNASWATSSTSARFPRNPPMIRKTSRWYRRTRTP